MQTLCSSLQTKSWRQNQSWYRNGKHNECELFQLQQIQRITKAYVTKTFLRLNIIGGKYILVSTENGEQKKIYV